MAYERTTRPAERYRLFRYRDERIKRHMEAAKNILYKVLPSNAMNGISADIVVDETLPCWKPTRIVIYSVFGVVTLALYCFTYSRRSWSDILLAMVYASYPKNIPSPKLICRPIEVSWIDVYIRIKFLSAWKKRAVKPAYLIKMVELKGIEPSTSSMPWRRSPNWATAPLVYLKRFQAKSILLYSETLVNKNQRPILCCSGKPCWEYLRWIRSKERHDGLYHR